MEKKNGLKRGSTILLMLLFIMVVSALMLFYTALRYEKKYYYKNYISDTLFDIMLEEKVYKAIYYDEIDDELTVLDNTDSFVFVMYKETEYYFYKEEYNNYLIIRRRK